MKYLILLPTGIYTWEKVHSEKDKENLFNSYPPGSVFMSFLVD